MRSDRRGRAAPAVLAAAALLFPGHGVAADRALQDRILAQFEACHGGEGAPPADGLRCIYPPLIERFGGRERFLALLEAAGQAPEEDAAPDDGGERLLGVEHRVGAIHVAGEELHARIETVTRYRGGEFTDGTWVERSYTFAASRDGGTSWTFLDATLDPRTLAPAWNEALEIPEPSETFTPD